MIAGDDLKIVKKGTRTTHKCNPRWHPSILHHTLALDEEIARMFNFTLSGVTLKRRDDDWLVVLRAESERGHWVAFIQAEDWADCWDVMTECVRRDWITWKRDKFNRLDK